MNPSPPETAMYGLHCLEQDLKEILRCPACHSENLSSETNSEAVICQGCSASYPIHLQGDWCSFLPGQSETKTKTDIQDWWGDLYRQLYAENDSRLTPELYFGQLEQLEDFFGALDHLAVTEMPLHELAGKRVLEIGSGSGAHSALFKKHGADIVSVDITPERVQSTALKFPLIPSGKGRAYQADAENLPFRDGQFDIVYSNGVLHHSDDTEACIDEVMRVLKPGGTAILMLYARHSGNVWFNIYPRGILSGKIFSQSQAEWMGFVTEGKPKNGTTRNPITRVYSNSEIKSLLDRFEIISLRRTGWEWDHFAIPRLSQIRRAIMKAIGFPAHPGAVPVAGTDYVPPCRLESRIGQYLGFNWNIKARKPDGTTQ